MVDYYPATMSYREINRMFPELAVVDEDEVQRLKDLQGRKDRGKGAPPKAKSAGEYKTWDLQLNVTDLRACR